MALVEAPVALYRDPHEIHTVEDEPESPYRALQDRSEGDIEDEALFTQQLPRRFRFLSSLLGQVHVGPAGKEVLLVPHALAVPQEDYLLHVSPPSVDPPRLIAAFRSGASGGRRV